MVGCQLREILDRRRTGAGHDKGHVRSRARPRPASGRRPRRNRPAKPWSGRIADHARIGATRTQRRRLVAHADIDQVAAARCAPGRKGPCLVGGRVATSSSVPPSMKSYATLGKRFLSQLAQVVDIHHAVHRFRSYSVFIALRFHRSHGRATSASFVLAAAAASSLGEVRHCPQPDRLGPAAGRSSRPIISTKHDLRYIDVPTVTEPWPRYQHDHIGAKPSGPAPHRSPGLPTRRLLPVPATSRIFEYWHVEPQERAHVVTMGDEHRLTGQSTTGSKHINGQGHAAQSPDAAAPRGRRDRPPARIHEPLAWGSGSTMPARITPPLSPTTGRAARCARACRCSAAHCPLKRWRYVAVVSGEQGQRLCAADRADRSGTTVLLGTLQGAGRGARCARRNAHGCRAGRKGKRGCSSTLRLCAARRAGSTSPARCASTTAAVALEGSRL